GKDWYLVHSLAYGIVFLLAFALLIPVSRFDWRTVTVPEFMRFEATVHFFSALVAALLLGASLLIPELRNNRHVFWIVLLITGFAWLQKKMHSFLFRTKFVKKEPAFDPSAPTVAEGDTVFRPRND
ncbi:MAG: hypothetical protein ACYTHN_02875, partial [Planctomycetota bacterium]